MCPPSRYCKLSRLLAWGPRRLYDPFHNICPNVEESITSTFEYRDLASRRSKQGLIWHIHIQSIDTFVTRTLVGCIFLFDYHALIWIRMSELYEEYLLGNNSPLYLVWM
ncbi:hypothetical protein ACJX0J_021884 [Zea mays]